MSKRGVVKWFSETRHSGKIAQYDGGPDLLVLRADVLGGCLLKDDVVTYSVEDVDGRGRKFKATNVSGGTGSGYGGDGWDRQSLHIIGELKKYIAVRWPLHAALDEGANKDILLALLHRYPGSIREKNTYYQLPLHHALESRASQDVVMMLLERYPEVARHRDYMKMLPLHVALENGTSARVLLTLLDLYPDAACKQDGDGRLPLQLALENDVSEHVVSNLIANHPVATWTDAGVVGFPFDLILEHGPAKNIMFELLCKVFVDRLPKAIVRGVTACFVGFIDTIQAPVLTAIRSQWLVCMEKDCIAESCSLAPNHENTSDVIEDILHEEPAAVRDEGLLQQQADQEWAANVEQLLHGTHSLHDAGAQSGEGLPFDEAVPDKVHVLRFGSGDYRSFKHALLFGTELHDCRDAMSAQGHSCELPSGALIFVHPIQYSDVVDKLVAWELFPYHVVISESLEYFLTAVLETFACRVRPREKCGTRMTIELEEKLERKAMEQSAFDMDAFVVERTFLCVARCLKEARTVAQSTTEAHCPESISHYDHFRGYNPRRFA